MECGIYIVQLPWHWASYRATTWIPGTGPALTDTCAFKTGPMTATTALRGSSALDWLPVLAGLLVLYIPTFFDLAGSHWQRDDYAHGPIILAVIAWLIWDKRDILLAGPASIAPVPGITLLVCGLLFYIVGRAHDLVIFEVGALVPILAGSLLSMRGWPALRALWFMLFFIAYLVPLPGFFVDALTLPMKQYVSETAAEVLYAAGYPIARAGVILTIGQYQLLVADACAGLNSMFSLTALGLLYLYVIQRRSWLHNGLMLASLLPIAFCANIVRVVILVLVTYHFGDAAGQGFVHGLSGLVLFIIALISTFLLDAILARLTKPRKPAQ
jgi:exosortase B